MLYSQQQTKLRPPGLSLSCLILPREVYIIHSVCLKRGPLSLFLSPFIFLPASDFKHPPYHYPYYLQQPTASLPRGPVMTLLADRKQTVSMSTHGVPWFALSLNTVLNTAKASVRHFGWSLPQQRVPVPGRDGSIRCSKSVSLHVSVAERLDRGGGWAAEGGGKNAAWFICSIDKGCVWLLLIYIVYQGLCEAAWLSGQPIPDSILCVCACVCARARACMCVCVCVCLVFLRWYLQSAIHGSVCSRFFLAAECYRRAWIHLGIFDNPLLAWAPCTRAGLAVLLGPSMTGLSPSMTSCLHPHTVFYWEAWK